MNIIDSVKEIFSIEKGSDRKSAAENILGDSILSGSNLFYLICSAILASVGLDINSPAVIIGAMLISPLMSPILGTGFSLGTHDKENFFSSLRQYTVSVAISLLISTLYFSLSPLGNATPELLARVKPTFLDIMVAFFGGTAGIVALTRSKMASAIPGVAIATALMPPVCTAGFGLAAARFDYFFGAIYLFFINTVFISFSAYLVVRYLKFPYKQYPDAKKIRKTRVALAATLIIVAVPSFFIFVSVINDARIKQKAEKFVTAEIREPDYKIIDWKLVSKDDRNILKIFISGNKMTKKKIDSLNTLLADYGIKNAGLNITHLSDEKGLEYLKSELSADLLEKIKKIQEEEKSASDEKLAVEEDSAVVRDIVSGLKIFIPGIESAGISMNHALYNGEDTLQQVKQMPLLTVKWKKGIRQSGINARQKELYDFAKTKLKADTVGIINLK
ncbi:MAG: DUF389 domain-containing protein [Ignavibacteria bacterium]|jgi:uncharacterized hydrophobic protein (TIGR00271 family)|nr:DUF389 domain-containing protein [Ignavibacteria bacterium]